MPRRLACILCLLAICFAERAFAAELGPLAGRWQWDGTQTCAPGYVGENAALKVSNKGLEFEENSCTIRTSKKLQANVFRLQLRCRGEGEIENRTTILALMPKSKVNDEQLIRLELPSGFIMAYRRCS